MTSRALSRGLAVSLCLLLSADSWPIGSSESSIVVDYLSARHADITTQALAARLFWMLHPDSSKSNQEHRDAGRLRGGAASSGLSSTSSTDARPSPRESIDSLLMLGHDLSNASTRLAFLGTLPALARHHGMHMPNALVQRAEGLYENLSEAGEEVDVWRAAVITVSGEPNLDLTDLADEAELIRGHLVDAILALSEFFRSQPRLLELVAQEEPQAVLVLRRLELVLAPYPVVEKVSLGPWLRVLFQRGDEGKEVTVEDVGPTRPMTVDASALYRLIANLVENSRQAGATRVYIRVTEERGAPIIRVSDNGSGMSTENLERARAVVAGATSEHFSTRSTNHLLNGFGLRSVRRSASLLGVGVTIASTPNEARGGGRFVTTFELRWPTVRVSFTRRLGTGLLILGGAAVTQIGPFAAFLIHQWALVANFVLHHFSGEWLAVAIVTAPSILFAIPGFLLLRDAKAVGGRIGRAATGAGLGVLITPLWVAIEDIAAILQGEGPVFRGFSGGAYALWDLLGFRLNLLDGAWLAAATAGFYLLTMATAYGLVVIVSRFVSWMTRERPSHQDRGGPGVPTPSRKPRLRTRGLFFASA